MTFEPGMLHFRDLSKRQKKIWLQSKIITKTETDLYIRTMNTNRTRAARRAFLEVLKMNGQQYTVEQLQCFIDECEKERLIRLH